jgi:hypothetical protein
MCSKGIQMKSNMKSLKLLVLSIIALMLSACVHTNNVLEIFDKNNTNAQFRGILDVIKETDKNVNILFVHGMGGYSSTDGVSDPCKVVNDLKENLKTEQVIDTSNKNSLLNCTGKINNQGQVISIQSNYWGNLTWLTKDILRDHDHDPIIVKHRSKSTTFIKDNLFNDGFADAVMYTGEAKKAIKDSLVASIKRLNDSNSNAITIIVTFSLGSKIVVDTVQEMSANKTLGPLENSVEMVYLMANQIPLINTGDRRDYFPYEGEESNADKKETFTSELTAKYERFNLLLTPTLSSSRIKDRIKIVAFTDPNDLLSYTLNAKTMGNLKDNYVNVGISVATKTFYIPFYKDDGIVNYYKAHTGYVFNDKVRDFLLHGNKTKD